MKRLNIKLLIASVILLTLLGGGIFLIHHMQSGRIAQALLWQARRAETQKRPDQVVRYLSRYLEFAPDDVEERANLGRTLADARVANSPRAKARAAEVLEQALTRDTEQPDLRRLLVTLYMDLQRFDAAGEHLRKLREAAPDNADVEYQFGQLHAAQNQFVEAARCFRNALRLAPQKLDAYTRLADVLRKPADPALQEQAQREAARVLDEMVKNNTDAHQAYLARWRFRKQSGGLLDAARLVEATRDVLKALELAPNDADVILAAADAARSRGDLKNAREQLERGFQLHASDARVYQAQVAVELQAGRRLEAVEIARRGTKTLTGRDQLALLWTLGNLLIDSGEMTEAEAVIGEINKAGTSPASVDYLRARRLLHDGRWAEAAKLLERVRTDSQMASATEVLRQIDLCLGHCYDQLDEPELRAAAFGRVLDQDSQSVAARVGMAEAQVALGRIDEALVQYRQAMLLPNAPVNGYVEIARLLLLKATQREPRDGRDVDAALLQAEKARPNAPEVIILRAEALAARGQLEQGEAILTEARDREPKQVAYWTALASFAERRKQPERAWQLLEEAEKKNGDSVALRLARARYWVDRHNADSATGLAKLRAGIEPFTGEDQSRLLRGLAEAYFRTGDTKAAGQLWEQLAAQPRHKNDLRLRLLSFTLALQADDKPAQQRLLDEIRGIEGGQETFWRYCEALRLIGLARQGDKAVLDEARAHLDAVAARRPGWAAVHLAKAELEELKGNTEQAVAQYRKAIDLGERGPRAVRQLVQLLYKRQRFDEADQEIRKLQRQTQVSSDLMRLAADVSLKNQDPLRAVEMALQAVSAESGDYRDHLWLGQILAASGQRTTEAEGHLKRAVEMNGKAPETWTALVRFLATANRAAEAAAALEQARQQLPADQAALALAQGYEALGRFEQAQEQYQAARTARPDDLTALRAASAFWLRVGRTADAEHALRAVLEKKDKLAGADLAWARRGLALVLAATGGEHRRFTEAMALVGLRLDGGRVVETAPPEPGEIADELRTRARVLASQRGKPFRTRAIALLDELSRRESLSAEDRFLLARLYDSDGVWPKARDLFRQLVADQKQQPTYWIAYARGTLRQGEFAEAERCVTRLEQLEQERKAAPGAFGSVDLKAALFEARGEGGRAIALLQAHQKRPNARPEEALVLAGYLARQNRAGEALDLCERAWETCSADAVGGASVAVLRTTKPTSEQITRVEGRLQAASEKEPKAVALLLQLADLRDLQGRYPEAEALYRRVLQTDDRNAVAMNNLAWLLTQHGGGVEALALIEKAITLVGPRPDLLDTRAAVHLALGRGDRAVADLAEATQDTPTATRYFHLARAHAQAKDKDAAVAALREARRMKLRAEQLHPAERPTLEQLQGELGVN